MLFAREKTPQLTPQLTTQHRKTNKKCRVKPSPPCTKTPPVWLSFSHRLNTIQTPFKRPLDLLPAIHPPHTIPRAHERQHTKQKHPKTPTFRSSRPQHVPYSPLFSPSRAFSPLPPSIPHLAPLAPSGTKKARKSSHVATFPRFWFNSIQPPTVQSSPQIKHFPKQN